MMNFETFINDVASKRIFRMLELRRVGDWTPLEIENKYIDQDQYVSSHYTFIKIVETIELPDKDILIGYKEIYGADDVDSEEYETYPIHYKKLSQIQLSFFPQDMEEGDFY